MVAWLRTPFSATWHHITGCFQHFYTPVFLQRVTNYPVMQHHIPQKWSFLYLQELKTKNPKYKHSEFLFWPTVMHSDTSEQLPVHSFNRIQWNNFTKCFIICIHHPALSRSWHSAIHSSVDIYICFIPCGSIGIGIHKPPTTLGSMPVLGMTGKARLTKARTVWVEKKSLVACSSAKGSSRSGWWARGRQKSVLYSSHMLQPKTPL